MINYTVDNGGIATLEWDLPGRSQNVLNEQSMAAFADAAQKALADPAVKGLLVASAKADFIAGGDLDMLLKANDAQAMSDNLKQWHKLFRVLETTGKPVAAALNGTTLGGGLELALACHYRVAADNEGALRLPDVTLGLLPRRRHAARAPRLMGIQAALLFLTEGKRIKAAEAQKQGLIHAVVAAGRNARRRALRRWRRRRRAARPLQPGTRRASGFSAAGHDARRHADLHGRQRHAAQKTQALPGAGTSSCVFEGMQTDIDTGLDRDALISEPRGSPRRRT
jgi:3-hydroxyacyl-CoA dehydrogenase/enoyl-CoA hydratase/3-hydroxybutyryl-CoA epimerase